MDNSYFENNDDIYNDDDSDSEIELLEYIDQTNNKVKASGKIKNQYVFEDTAKLFGAITKNEILVDFNEEMKVRTHRGDTIETPLIKDVDNDHTYKISIPVNNKLVDNEQDIYSYFLMRPLAQLFGKSDVRNLAILLADNKRLNESEQAATEIWKTTEAHRIESFYNKLRLGTYADIQRLNKKSFDNRKIDNIIDAVKAVHAKREELIPKKYADLVQPVKTLLQRVERSDPNATNIITKRIFDIVEQELSKEQQKQDQAQARREQKEKDRREKEAQEQGQQPTEQQLPTPEELAEEVQVCKAEPTQGQEGSPQTRLEDFPDQGSSLQDKVNEKLRKAAVKSNRKEIKDQNFTNIDIDTEVIRHNDEFTDTTSEEKLDELLDKSNRKGEDMIDKLSEKLIRVEQDTKPQQVSTNFDSIDQELSLSTDDEIGVSQPEKTYDVVLSRQLRHMFQNMRSKFRNIRSDSSGIMNIKRTIQYMAGDREAKIYDRNIKQEGINIRFLVDCSGSMSAPVNDKTQDMKDYYRRKSKMSASKELLITMLEATKGLEYIDLKILAYGAAIHSNVPEIDRKRVETIYSGGGTPTGYGIRQAHLDLKKCKSGQKLIIHLTDGEPNSVEAARDAIRAAEKDGIKIFTVMLPNSEKLDHKKYNSLEYIFGKGKFEPIFQWSNVRRVMTHKIANSITSMLQGY